MTSLVDFAILAPVPEDLLESGKLVAASAGFVAYGSRKWDLFREVDRIREGDPVPMLIYPSHEDLHGKLTFIVAWKAWYIGHVNSVVGAIQRGRGIAHLTPRTKTGAFGLCSGMSKVWNNCRKSKGSRSRRSTVTSRDIGE